MNIIAKFIGSIIAAAVSLIGGYIIGSLFGKRINTGVKNTYTSARDKTVSGARNVSERFSSAGDRVAGVFRRKEKKDNAEKQERAAEDAAQAHSEGAEPAM